NPVLVLQWSRAKTILVDFQCANLRFKRRARDAKASRSPRWPKHAPATLAQRALNHRFFLCGERPGQGVSPLDAWPGGEPAFVNCEFLGVAHDYGALDHVLQLSHIPRPWIRPQAIERPLVDPPDGLSGFPCVAIDEVFDEHRNIVGSFS